MNDPTPRALADERLAFLIGSPRSGTTLLSRMLSVHPEVFSPAEPHLMPPLAHLGFYETVERAPYDPAVTQRGLREFVGTLPRGEEDFLDALRACTDLLYARSLGASGRRIFLDQTPAYALVTDFVTRLYPGARYVVLTRHPMAIWCSQVDSFFDGDHEAALRQSPILERYVPALARFLRERPAPLVHVRYEALVSEPAASLEPVCRLLGIDFRPAMVDYGEQEGGQRQDARGLGDPVTVAREKRPTTSHVKKWVQSMGGDPGRLAAAREILARLADEDLEQLGYPRGEIEADLLQVDPQGPRPPRARLTRFALERRLIVRLRRRVHAGGALGRGVRALRNACDVLLR